MSARLQLALALFTWIAPPEQPAAVSDEATTRPNFILVLVDDQSWTGTSVQLHPEIAESRSDFYRTPHLERLAAEGMRFSSAYSPAPNCSPSRCSILTGLAPARTGMTDLWNRRGANTSGPFITARNVNAIDRERLTLPERLKQIDAEYRTAHFGKWHLGSGGPSKHGFDVSDGISTNHTGNTRIPDDPKLIFSVTARSIAFLEELAAGVQPFYLQVSHYAVHKGTEALEATKARYREREPGDRHDGADYAAMVEDLDTGLGLLLDAVERLGLAENTYVIYVSDNGAGRAVGVTNNRPLRAGKTSLWEGGLRVPMVVRGPGVPAGAHSATRVVGQDLYPTICDLAGGGADVPDDLDGGSLANLLHSNGDAEVTRSRDFLVFHFPHYQIPKGTVPQSAIYRGPYKLTKYWPDGAYRLHAIDTDITESDDLSGSSPELAAELDRLLTNYLAEVGALMASPNPEWDASKQAEFDEVFGVDEE